MNGRIAVYLCAAWLSVAACECDDARAPTRSVQRSEPPSPTTGEGAPPAMPAPEGTPVPAERLAPHAPDAIAGFTASGPAEQRSTPLPNGGELTAVRRSYMRDAAKLHLEISDSLHAPGVRKLVSSQQGATRKAASVDFRGMEVAGQPAIVQWHGATQTAAVNMLINGRFLANVKVTPAADAAPAIEAASALPIAEITKLAPPAAMAAQTAPDKTPPEKQAPEKPAAQEAVPETDAPAKAPSP